MNVKRISSGVLAAVMLLSTNISFANESSVEKIKDFDSVSKTENKN